MTLRELGNDLKLLVPGGRVIVIGSSGGVQITPRDIMIREASVIGMFLWSVSEPDLLEIHAALQAGLSDRELRPVIGLELPLASASEAHRRIMESRALGKTVLIP